MDRAVTQRGSLKEYRNYKETYIQNQKWGNILEYFYEGKIGRGETASNIGNKDKMGS